MKCCTVSWPGCIVSASKTQLGGIKCQPNLTRHKVSGNYCALGTTYNPWTEGGNKFGTSFTPAKESLWWKSWECIHIQWKKWYSSHFHWWNRMRSSCGSLLQHQFIYNVPEIDLPNFFLLLPYTKPQSFRCPTQIQWMELRKVKKGSRRTFSFTLCIHR